jgi:hypothetical protein
MTADGTADRANLWNLAHRLALQASVLALDPVSRSIVTRV